MATCIRRVPPDERSANPDDMVRTTLIIPTLSRPHDLARCLRSIGRLRRTFDEIVIVEQGDVSATERVVADFGHLRIRIRHQAIRSAARARNTGIDEAKGEVLFFVDDDTELDERYVETAVDYLDRHPRVVGLTGWIEEVNAAPYVWRLFKRLAGALLLVTPLHHGIFRSGAAAPLIFVKPNPWSFPEVQFLPGGHCVYRRTVFEAGFRFNRDFILWSFGEDTMLSCQVHKHYGRGSLAYVPEFRLRHHASPEQGPSDAAIRMRVLYRYVFWRSEVHGGSLFNGLCYLYSQLGFSFFVFNRYRQTPLRTLRTLGRSYRYLLANHREIARGRADYNRFITFAGDA